MANIIINLKDLEEGLDISFTSDTEMPDNYDAWTPAQKLAAMIHGAIGAMVDEHSGFDGIQNEDTISKS